jgi:chromosome segregation ATPase
MSTQAKSIESLQGAKTALEGKMADATKNIQTLTEQKGAVEEAHKTATAEVTTLKGQLADTQKEMESTRTSFFQEMDTSRVEAETALARLEKLAASFGRAPGTAKNVAARGTATVAQTAPVQKSAATGAVSNAATQQDASAGQAQAETEVAGR